MKLVVAIFSLLAIFSIQADTPKLPPDAANALHAPTNLVLYSLEPLGEPTAKDRTLHGVKILGETKLEAKEAKTAIAAFETAIALGAGGAGAHCFNPRRALRVMANGQTYDFMLCYQCAWLWVMSDDKGIARVCAIGTPDQAQANVGALGAASASRCLCSQDPKAFQANKERGD